MAGGRTGTWRKYNFTRDLSRVEVEGQAKLSFKEDIDKGGGKLKEKSSERDKDHERFLNLGNRLRVAGGEVGEGWGTG